MVILATMMSRICLISCASLKSRAPAPAAELYRSTLFAKTRAYAEANTDAWYILSAEHGLLHPETVVEPYDRTLNRMTASERRSWAMLVIDQMHATIPASREVVVLAGERYRENIIAWMSARFQRVTIPMAGLTIGRQLQWLKAAGF